MGTDVGAAPTFGDLLREHRRTVGLTQEELAERATLSREAISALERGERTRPQRETVALLAEALDLDPDELEAFSIAGRSGAHSGLEQRGRQVGPTNLPIAPTPLIGRDDDLARACAFLGRDDLRLLTLTGPGGVGKTRLALDVAATMRPSFPDGVYFAALASLHDPQMLAARIGETIGVQATGTQSAEVALKDYLRERGILLVLDNFEHLEEGAPLLAELLAECGELALLVTSRSAVRIRGEQVVPLAPLALPGPGEVTGSDRLVHIPAVALFLQRALAVDPDLELTEECLEAVAEICRRLDGLPLAIELAAARVAMLPPPAMLSQLTEMPALNLLTEGARDLPERQRTLRQTLAWSVDLLDEVERRVFRHLAVFAGGASLDAAAAVCLPGDDGVDATAVLATLVDKSLLKREAGATEAPRLSMLETVRAYAQELLEEEGEADAGRRRHAAYMVAFVEEAVPHLIRPEQAEWLVRLDGEIDNIRAALRWAEGSDDAELHLRLTTSLFRYWYTRGYQAEGRGWLERAARRVDVAPPLMIYRARVLGGAALLSVFLGDFNGAEGYAEAALEVALATGDPGEIGKIYSRLSSIAKQQGDFERSAAMDEQALRYHRDAGNEWEIAGTLTGIGRMAQKRGEHDEAAGHLHEALEIMRRLGDPQGESVVLGTLALLAAAQGGDDGLERAVELHEAAIAIDRTLGYKRGLAIELDHLAAVLRRKGDLGAAYMCVEEALDLWLELGDPVDLAFWFEMLAELEAAAEQPESAARFFGAAASVRVEVGHHQVGSDGEEEYEWVAAVREMLGKPGFDAARAGGEALGREHAVSEARRVLGERIQVSAAMAGDPASALPAGRGLYVPGDGDMRPNSSTSASVPSVLYGKV